MPGQMSRNKGARAEREFIAILQRVVEAVLGDQTFELKRNLFQTREGGDDVAGAPEKFDFFSLEIKRQETLCLPAWRRQAKAQTQPHQWAILAYRQNYSPWGIIMEEPKTGEVYEVDLDDFLKWFRSMLVIYKHEG